jgi:peptide/nickel transport system substrate-binding protein
MKRPRERARLLKRHAICATGLLLALAGTIGCGSCGNSSATPTRTDSRLLRVGVGGAPTQTAERGVLQFISNVSNEGLLRVDQGGRVEPWLAEAWHLSPDGMQLTVQLRPNVTFHDGSRVEAEAVAQILRENMPKILREDVKSISVTNPHEISLQFRQPSTFVAESLFDIPIQKPGATGSGTGPFMLTTPYRIGTSSAEMTANSRYYLGGAALPGIVIKTYPNVRAAWAELLRDRLDMLYEVGADAIDSLRGAKGASIYTFDRPYQYIVILNTKLPKLRSRQIRRALNQAVDRLAIVRAGLDGAGTPSAGPVSQHHWAFRNPGTSFDYVPSAAGAILGASPRLSFKCLTPAGPPFDRVALLLKQQLQAVGVDMSIEEVAPESVMTPLSRPDFEAELIDPASGWGLFRSYRWWYSNGPTNLTGYSSRAVDDALDRVRHAANDDDYREAVAAFEGAIADDPPAIFLAWSSRSRAVSRRFETQAEGTRDVLSTLRLWKPSGAAARPRSN